MDPFSTDLWRRELSSLHWGGSQLIFNSALSFFHISIMFLSPICHTVDCLRLVSSCGNSFNNDNITAVRRLLLEINYLKNMSSPRLSHLLRLHLRVWIEGPVQGLLVASHDLPLCWVPVPQVTVHSVHSDHGDQPSSLSFARRIKSKMSTFYSLFCVRDTPISTHC